MSDTFAPGVEKRYALSPFYGRCLQIVGGLRALDDVGTNHSYRSWISIGELGTVELFDGNSQNVVGGSPLNFWNLRYNGYNRRYNAGLTETLPLVFLSFGRPESIYYGPVNGYMDMSRLHQFAIKPDATWVSGSYVLSLFGYFYRKMQIKDGRISVGN